MAEQRVPERKCLFGGTFDPVHIGHLRIANEALKTFALSQVIFIPAGQPPHKDLSLVTPFEDRRRMLEIACAPYPSFAVSAIEATQQPSYTLNTLERFRQDMTGDDKLFFLIGADAFAEIRTWHEWEQVLLLTDFIVVSRPGTTYTIPAGARVHALEGLDLPISSSDLRQRLRSGEAAPEVPAEVREYIDSRGLYRSGISAVT